MLILKHLKHVHHSTIIHSVPTFCEHNSMTSMARFLFSQSYFSWKLTEKKKYTYIYICIYTHIYNWICISVYLKLTQYYKSTILQLQNRNKCKKSIQQCIVHSEYSINNSYNYENPYFSVTKFHEKKIIINTKPPFLQ